MKVWTVDEETGRGSAPRTYGESLKLTIFLMALSSSTASYEEVLLDLGRVQLIFQAKKHLNTI